MSKAFGVVYNHICKLIFSHRTYTCVALQITSIFCLLQPFVLISKHLNLLLTPLGFVFLVNNHTAHFVLSSCIIFLFSNAPYIDDTTPYIISRAGLTGFATGNIIFIFMLSVLYTIAANIFCILCILPVITWNLQWGNGWELMANSPEIQQFFRVFDIDSYIIKSFDACFSLIISIILEICSTFFMGMIAMILNRLTKKYFGILVAIIFFVMDVGISNLFPLALVKISPLTLSSITAIFEYSKFVDLDLFYAFKFFFFSLTCMVIFYYWIECIYYARNRRGVL